VSYVPNHHVAACAVWEFQVEETKVTAPVSVLSADSQETWTAHQRKKRIEISKASC
jgi:hypothetical protein